MRDRRLSSLSAVYCYHSNNMNIVVGAIPGTVRFCGETEFAPGKWIGLELDSYEGRNDGSVQGIRYFSCENGKGLFKRPIAVVAMTPQEILDNRPASLEVNENSSNTRSASAIAAQSDEIPVAAQIGCQILVCV